VACMDDDCVATPTWLSTILKVFQGCFPRPGMVGGRIEGIWEAPRPEWLSDHMLGMLGIIDWGGAQIVLTDKSWLPIGNMAMPRMLLQEVGGLREDLGRQGSTLRANEEVYLGKQLKSLGYNLVYDPRIEMHHHVHASRLTRDYFKKWYYWQGRSDAIMLDLAAPLSRLARVLLVVRKLAWAALRLPLIVVAPKPADRFRQQCQMLEVYGLLTGLVRPGEQR